MVVSGKEAAPAPVVGKKSGRWGELNPDVLAFIFLRLPVDEMVRIVPLVCKPWMEAVAGPYCWRHIDVEEWCRRRNDGRATDIAVKKLVRWSGCTFHRLSAYRLGSPGFIFIANRGRCLTTLQIPNSNINDNVVLNHINLLPNLKELDVSYCYNITAKGLEAFGNQCKSLVCLKRNMSQKLYTSFFGSIYIAPMDDSEAKIIADTMVNLQHLELSFNSFGDAGLSEILTKCKSLMHLDIQGCCHVKLKGDLKEISQKIEYFLYVKPRHEYSDESSDRFEYFDSDESSDSEDSL